MCICYFFIVFGGNAESNRCMALPRFHFAGVRCTTPMKWHFEIYFSQGKTFPSLSLSQRCALRLTACSPGSGGGFERKFALARSFLPFPHLRQARSPGVWERCGNGGTRLRSAVEMAVSIKYHFQFPCFMIPGLLSTNNPPSAGPPTLSWGRLITLVASYKKDIYMKIRKQLLCLHGSESRKKAIPNLIFIQRRGKITISWRLISVSFGGRAKKEGRAKMYVDWIKLANYFHATLMDVVFTHTMKMSPILWQRLLPTCVLHAVCSFPEDESHIRRKMKKFVWECFSNNIVRHINWFILYD